MIAFSIFCFLSLYSIFIPFLYYIPSNFDRSLCGPLSSLLSFGLLVAFSIPLLTVCFSYDHCYGDKFFL
uniref:NADH dehydrogenase subunit 5 n=1 Tax=Panagrolaimus sp. ES5 TaxID=591445 RepID=A0AC34FE86_9BILA